MVVPRSFGFAEGGDATENGRPIPLRETGRGGFYAPRVFTPVQTFAWGWLHMKSSVYDLDSLGTAKWWRVPLIAAVLLLLPASSVGQQEERRVGGAGFFVIGAQSLPLDLLGDAMASADLGRPEAQAISLGGGGHGRFGRVRFGGEGHALLVSTPSTRGVHTEVGGGYGLLTLGYDVRPEGRIALSPIVGVGGGAITVHVADDSGFTFHDALRDPGREAQLHRAAVLGSLGGVVEGTLGEIGDGKAIQMGLEAEIGRAHV